MPQILASGKTGSQRYEDLEPTKPCPDLDDITLIQNFQNAYEETQGYSLCNNKGNTDSIDTDLDDITLANVSTYNKNLAQLIQTYVANGSYLDVDPTSTANNIILVPRKIANINSPNGNNYAKATSLPFTYRDNLRFAFRAAANNTGATQFSITGLSGLVGAKDLVDETGANLAGEEIVAGRFYEIVLTGTGGTQKGVLIGVGRESILINPTLKRIDTVKEGGQITYELPDISDRVFTDMYKSSVDGRYYYRYVSNINSVTSEAFSIAHNPNGTLYQIIDSLGHNLSSNGYKVLNNGLMVAFGTGSNNLIGANAVREDTFIFPKAFSAIYGCITSNAAQGNVLNSANIYTTQIMIRQRNCETALSQNSTPSWVIFGVA